MAAKGSHMMEKLRDETECCICTGTFVDPRVLPCLHTFCLKCIQTVAAVLRKKPRQLMTCPVCRKEFNIPESGLAGLQKNFLIERLINIVKSPNSGPNEFIGFPCEACREEVDICQSASVPVAEFYCADCKQKLCNECSVHHRKNKMTKLHAISRLANGSKTKCFLKNSSKRCCSEHRSDIFVYCLDCMDDFCPRCSGHIHKMHRSSSRRKIIDEYSQLVDAKVKEFTDVEHHTQVVKEEVDKKEDAFIQKVDFLEKCVAERSEKIKQLVDTHTKLLQEEIKSKKEETLESIKLEREQLDRLLACVIGYREDCAERREFLSVDALILTMNSIKAKAENLTQLRKACLNCCDSNHVEVAFGESDIDDFLGKSNVVGQVKGTKTHVISRPCNQSAHVSEEPALLACSDKDDLPEYSLNPKLVQTIKMRSSTCDNKAVRGVALLGDELFIVHKESTILYKYDASTFEYITDMKVNELNDPCDIASCKSNQCLYVFDRDYHDEPYRILCLDTSGRIVRTWITGNSDSSLSVTYDSNIIVAYRDKTILKEYSEYGRLLRELVIRIEDGVYGFLHAHKLRNGLFLMSYSGDHDRHGLSLVDGNGVLKSVSETGGPGNDLDVPCSFAVDGSGSILLVDKNNRRVLLFSADLERSFELVTKDNGLHYPVRVILDERNGRMFVADNSYDFTDQEYINGRVLVFQVNNV